MSRLRYYVHYVIHDLFGIIVAPLQRSLMSAMALVTIDGIKIVDSSRSRKKDSRFCTDTVAALELIKSVDPRRYRRLQREVRFITNCEVSVWATYDRSCRNCEVHYGRLSADSELRDWNLRIYAATLVHEATHGAIHSRCIAYTSRLRARIENLCVTDENRFVRRLDTPEICWSESLVCPFDERDWHSTWHASYIRRVKEAWQRLRESLRSEPEE